MIPVNIFIIPDILGSKEKLINPLCLTTSSSRMGFSYWWRKKGDGWQSHIRYAQKVVVTGHPHLLSESFIAYFAQQ